MIELHPRLGAEIVLQFAEGHGGAEFGDLEAGERQRAGKFERPAHAQRAEARRSHEGELARNIGAQVGTDPFHGHVAGAHGDLRGLAARHAATGRAIRDQLLDLEERLELHRVRHLPLEVAIETQQVE